jgi:hypothetical protein
MRSVSAYWPAGLLLSLILPLSVCGCKPEAAGHGGLEDIIKAATEPVEAEEASAQDFPETVIAQVEYQGGPFRVLARKGEIERFRCTGCHKGGEGQVRSAAEMVHGDIIISHGEEERRLTCYTCHSRDMGDFLVTLEGERVDFDHSYQLCGFCHFRQKKDWIGGAHGKRVSYWAGDRVINNCTSCHNPHSPRFATRWPATFSLPLDEME